ncbi:hypothetical protein [Aminobacter sp. LjRoot7]|uniref:hypothetical protein n=1 Tax=Aminobacter sp. LjRoot7 TaxID=3342335 RepID=UPI003F508C29
MTEHITAASALASKGDPLAPRGPLTCSIDMTALRSMSMLELRNFRSVMHSLADVLCGLCSQPRFFEAEEYNKAGKVIDCILDFIGSYEQAAVNVAVATKPGDAASAENRAWTIISFEADMADNLAEIAVLATEAIRDVAALGRARSAA